MLIKSRVCKKVQEANYLVAELIKQHRISYTLGKKVIMPAYKIITAKMLGSDAVWEIEKVWSGTINQHNEELLCDTEIFLSKLMSRQIFTNKCHVKAFVRLVNDGEIVENFLLQRTDMFCFHIWKHLSRRNCIDGDPSMVGSMKGFISLVRKEHPDVVTTHCFLYRKALVSKTLVDGIENFQILLQKWSIY